MRATGLIGLVAAVLVAAVLAAWWQPRPLQHPPWPQGAVPRLTPRPAQGLLRVETLQGRELLLADGPDGPLLPTGRSLLELPMRPDARQVARMLATPSAVQWNHPLPGLPMVQVLRVAEVDDLGRRGPLRMHSTLFAHHGGLAVVSLAMAEGALFDPDTGIYVVGHSMLAPTPQQRSVYREDGRWWKYPGNYSMRGKAWERAGHVQLMHADGHQEFQGPVGVRVHGNMTRGFPQKALRLTLDAPLPMPLFPGGEGRGGRTLLLRAAGNDGNKALMRDAVANELCAGMPFEVSRARPAVLYLNGAYWGIHHLRQRLDEKELARRHGLATKQLHMLEVELLNIHGDPAEAAQFRDLVQRAGQGDADEATFLEMVERELDVDGFLAYMAACMVLGQRDWPLRNVRLWRHAGAAGRGGADGRWRFLLNDMDLALGAATGPEAALFNELDRQGYALPDLWRGLMRSADLRARFARQVEQHLQGPLSADRMCAQIDAFADALGPEMDRHVARWRKPLSSAAWRQHVETMRTFARQRPDAVRRQLEDKQWTP